MAPSSSELYLALGAIFVIVALIYLSQYLNSFKWTNKEVNRKMVHVVAGLMAAASPLYFSSPSLLILIAVLFSIVNLLAIKRNLLPGIHGQRVSYGTVYFPLAFLVLIFALWDLNREVITLGIAIFAIADAAAALAGQQLGKKSYFRLISDDKSVAGSVVMFCGTFIISLTWFMLLEETSFSFIQMGLISLAVAIISTITELLSAKGSDNLFVPVMAALWMMIFLSARDNVVVKQIYLAMALAAIVSMVSLRLRFLSLSGSAMTFLLATAIFGLGGIKWTLPIFTFFVLSSILSKTGQSRKREFSDTFEKSGTRDYAQVLANGGLGFLLVVGHFFYNDSRLFELYLISLAVAMADTWGTEIGVYFKVNPILITTFKKVKPGVSGGISFPGTAGAIAGSAILVGSAWYFLPAQMRTLTLFTTLTGFGFLGSVLDSILGATVQAQYKCAACGKYTEKSEHCQRSSLIYSGYRFITNDAVNFGSALLSMIIYFVYTS